MKASFNFDADSLMKKVMEQAKETMKKNFKKDIENLARPYGEHPKISFVDKGDKSVSVKVENVSDELKAKIDAYIKSNSK